MLFLSLTFVHALRRTRPRATTGARPVPDARQTRPSQTVARPEPHRPLQGLLVSLG